MRHSIWSWKLWNLRRVSMLVAPGPLFTVRIPEDGGTFFTIQFAGPLSLVLTHSSRFLPSKRMIASEGGSESTAPGVTTLGTGSQTSVSCGLGLWVGWANRAGDRAIS